MKARIEKIDATAGRAVRVYIRLATIAKMYASGPTLLPACADKGCKVCSASNRLFSAIVNLEAWATVPDPKVPKSKKRYKYPTWAETRIAEKMPAHATARLPENLGGPGPEDALPAVDRLGTVAKDYALKEVGDCADPSCRVCRGMRPLLRALAAAERVRRIKPSPYTTAHKKTWSRILNEFQAVKAR